MTHGPFTDDPATTRHGGYGCAAAGEDLQRLLDGEPASDAALFQEHRRTCAECRALFAAARVLLDGLHEMPATMAPPTLARRAVVVVERDRRRARVRRWGGAAVALAASVLIAVFVLRPSAPAVDATELLKAVVVAAGPPSQPLKDRLAEAGSAVAALTRKTADATLDRTLSLFPRPELPTGGFPAERMEPAMQSLAELRSGAAAGLEPIADSARRAFDLLRREFSPSDPAPKPKL